MKILKRSFCLLSAIAVFICSFALPIAAIDIDDGYSDFELVPLYNLIRVQVKYYDDTYMAFDIPSFFYDGTFLDNLSSSNRLTIVSSDGSRSILLSDMRFIPPSGSEGHMTYDLYFTIDFGDIKAISFEFRDSIIPYSNLSGAITPFTFSYGGSNSESQVLEGDGSYYTAYYPIFVYEDETLVGKELGSVSGTFGRNPDVVPGGLFWRDFVSEKLPAELDYNQYIYLSDFYTQYSIYDDTVSDDRASFVVPFIKLDQTISFSGYFSHYFNNIYVDIDPDISFDFTGWLVTAVGGFFDFEFVPGISLGGIFMFVFGIGLVMSFLKFFAGG